MTQTELKLLNDSIDVIVNQNKIITNLLVMLLGVTSFFVITMLLWTVQSLKLRKIVAANIVIINSYVQVVQALADLGKKPEQKSKN